MLIVTALNIGGTDDAANYEVDVRVNDKAVWSGRVKGHNRDRGWPVLLEKIAATYRVNKAEEIAAAFEREEPE